MSEPAALGKIDLQLVKVLHTVISEGSVSRAALRLGTSQPAVSAQLKRLRELTGDALLVRSGRDMAPTVVARSLVEPAAHILREAELIFGAKRETRAFDPATSELVFTLAASDYLDPLFLPELVARIQQNAPRVRIDLHALSSDFDYQKSLACGDVDLVIGNWLRPPGELHLARLCTDEIVCLVSEEHPALRNPRAWNEARYLAAQHVAPSFLAPGERGVIDEHLESLGLARHIAVRSPHFGLIPLMVAQTHLVLTTGRQFCARYVDTLPLAILRCPVEFPPLMYYQLWHEMTHASPPGRWLREQVREVARTLASHNPPARRRSI